MASIPLQRIVDCVNELVCCLSQATYEGQKYRGFPDEFTDEVLAPLSKKLAIAQSYISTIRNGQRSRVCTLPPEILDHIFTSTMPTTTAEPAVFRSPLVFGGSDGRADLGMSSRWHPVRLTGVCRYWRAITSLSPSIWTIVNFGDRYRCPNSNQSLAQLCLQRSCSAPLDVFLWTYIPGEFMPWVTETLPTQSARFRSFHVYGFSFGPSLLEAFCRTPASQLQSLLLWSDSHEPITLPVLFDGSTPALRCLTLNRIESWRGNTFAGLTVLRLKSCAQGLSYAEFLAFLASSPSLEELSLFEGGPYAEAIPSAQKIPLPFLSTIHMHKLPVESTSAILSHIIPSSKDLRIHVGNFAAGLVSPAHTLAELLSYEGLKHVQRVQLERLSSGIRIAGAGPSSSFTFAPETHPSIDDTCIDVAVDFLARSSITEAWLRPQDDKTDPLWQRVLLAMPGVTRLVLESASLPCCTGLLAALCQPVDDQANGVGASLRYPLPYLSEIVFMGPLHSERDAALWNECAHCLKQRTLGGSSVERVIIGKCGFRVNNITDYERVAQCFSGLGIQFDLATETHAPDWGLENASLETQKWLLRH